MKKGFLFLIFLIAFVAAIGTAHATPYGGTITNVYVSGSPFFVDVDDTFTWNTSWSGSPGTEWIEANSLSVPIGSHTFSSSMDVDQLPYGYPYLSFTSGMLDGVDFFAADYQIGDFYYAFTTNTPLPYGADANFDFSTFSIFSYGTNYSYAEYLIDYNEYLDNDKTGTEPTLMLTTVLSGKLSFEPVPEPSTLVLFGVGLMGVLACFKKKIR